MNFIKQYFEKKRAAKEALRLRNIEIDEALALRRSLLQKEAQEKIDMQVIMESSSPWYKLIGEPYDPENPPKKPVRERYKWNAAWITDLRERGYKGESDAEVITKWEEDTARKRAERLIELERDEKKKSSEPWVEIVSETYDPDTKQVAIKLDWNSAFIKMLKQNGYTGRDDQQIVDKYFKRLSEDIAAELHGSGYGN